MMQPNAEGLYEIANTDNTNRVADVVFVHGLGGSSHGTWCCGDFGAPSSFFWPEELGKDLPNCGIWSVGYPAGISQLGAPGMIIEKRAGNLSQKLANAGIGDRPIFFVCHSMGGLVVKSLVVGSQTLPDPDRKKIGAKTAGIVFCATPHRGSQLADAAGILCEVIGGSQDHVEEMRANAEPLDILHDEFVEWQSRAHAKIESYAENFGIGRRTWLGRVVRLPLVVPRASANPGIAGHSVRDVDEDHLSIVKPSGRGHDVFAGVLRFIKEVLADPREPTAPQESRSAPAELVRSSSAARAGGTQHDISRILEYAPVDLIGREQELKLLDEAWDKAVRGEEGRPKVLTLVALGGEGKTALVAKWAVDHLNARGWPGCDAAFAWSFYSQGTREQMAASSDVFLKEALTFFGEPETAESAQSAFDKARRLARIVGEKRALLVLDGLEPLQYAPTSPTPGELKDQGISALLKGLAASNAGLCVATTRYSIPDLRAYWRITAPEVELNRLSREAGVHLLKTLGVKGTAKEFESLVEDVKGHALTLTLMGRFLKRAFHGDIRQRDRVRFQKADDKADGGHAFRTMAAYERWLLSDGGDEGKREIAVLRLMGLFDRPAEAGCLAALRKPPLIQNLTEPLVDLAEEDWEFCLTGLGDAKLLTVNRDASGALVSLDAHPHVREYFAKGLREKNPDAWRAAHRRLYEHLCETAPECTRISQEDALGQLLGTRSDKPLPTLEDLQPLYQAVAHGCQAGLQQRACDDVYLTRIKRGNEHYSTQKLGAFGSDLGAVACFFEQPWNHVSLDLTEADHAWLLNLAAFRLRALGRLSEALDPMRAALEVGFKQENWESAAAIASNLSELELALGEVAGAVGDAEQSVTYADLSGDAFQRMGKRTTHADALHQAGRWAEAETRFREAEQMQQERQPDYPLLYSVQGFKFCDLLLAAPERAAWQSLLNCAGKRQRDGAVRSCRNVSQRAAQTLEWAERALEASLLDIALDHLTLGRAALYVAILDKSEIRNSKFEIEEAVSGLLRSGHMDDLPRGLLTRAWMRFLADAPTGPNSAQEDLDEAWEIAERGPMKLHMADIHLHRARLFHAVKPYPWNTGENGNPRGPKDDLAAVRTLIEQCGYWRRKEELEDAEEAAKQWG